MELTEREWEVIRDALDYYSRRGGGSSHPGGLVAHANQAIARDLWYRFSFERV